MKNSYIPKDQRKTILFMADDLRLPSGIGTMTRELILGSIHKYNYIHIAGGVEHPEAGKVIDLSSEVAKETGVLDASLICYPYSGYGDADLVRYIIEQHKIDAIVHFTDPRYWIWFYQISAEVRQKVPVFYYHIWDDLPAPHYNKPYYESCDLLMGISKQSNNIAKLVLGENNYINLNDETSAEEISKPAPKVCYIPHGINTKYFYPVDKENEELVKFRKNLFQDEVVEFALLYNNRNIRRKMTSDIILAYKLFYNKLPADKASKTRLVLHTQVIDEHGTDLNAVIETLCPELENKIVFTKHRYDSKSMNLLYNSCDVVVNLGSNEGWGLSSTEAMVAGIPIINNVTGGLQDQMRFEDENGNWIEFNEDFGSNHTGKYKKHGEWAKPVFPSSISVQGSIPTPYIFDDRCSIVDISTAMMYWYEKSPAERKELGLKGYEFATGEESKFTADKMVGSYISATEKVLENWKPIPRFKLYNAKQYIQNLSKRKTGITLSYE